MEDEKKPAALSVRIEDHDAPPMARAVERAGGRMVQLPVETLRELMQGRPPADALASVGLGAAPEMAGNLDLLMLTNMDRVKEARRPEPQFRDLDIFSCVIAGSAESERDASEWSLSMFTASRGQWIPRFQGVEHPVEHYGPAHTNLRRPGMLGNLGNAAVRALGVYIERARDSGDGSYTDWGATPDDLEEIRNKALFSLVINDRVQFSAPLRHLDFSLPPDQRVIGQCSGEEREAFAKQIMEPETERWVAHGARGFKIPIPIDAHDTLEARIDCSALRLTPRRDGRRRGVLVFGRLLATCVDPER